MSMHVSTDITCFRFCSSGIKDKQEKILQKSERMLEGKSSSKQANCQPECEGLMKLPTATHLLWLHILLPVPSLRIAYFSLTELFCSHRFRLVEDVLQSCCFCYTFAFRLHSRGWDCFKSVSQTGCMTSQTDRKAGPTHAFSTKTDN